MFELARHSINIHHHRQQRCFAILMFHYDVSVSVLCKMVDSFVDHVPQQHVRHLSTEGPERHHMIDHLKSTSLHNFVGQARGAVMVVATVAYLGKSGVLQVLHGHG